MTLPRFCQCDILGEHQKKPQKNPTKHTQTVDRKPEQEKLGKTKNMETDVLVSNRKSYRRGGVGQTKVNHTHACTYTHTHSLLITHTRPGVNWVLRDP